MSTQYKIIEDIFGNGGLVEKDIFFRNRVLEELKNKEEVVAVVYDDGKMEWAIKDVNDDLMYNLKSGAFAYNGNFNDDQIFLSEGVTVVGDKLLLSGTEVFRVESLGRSGGKSVRKSVKSSKKKSSKKTVKKDSPLKTTHTHKCKDGVMRKLYKKGTDFYVKMKSKITGKFGYRKVKV